MESNWFGCDRGVLEPVLFDTRSGYRYEIVMSSKGFLRPAQLARASPLQGEGRGFESLNAHYFILSRASPI